MPHSSPISLGIIGLGAMGAEMLSVAAAHPAVDVVVAADPDSEARRRASDDHGATRFIASSGDVLDSELVDAVYIATPPAHHAEYTTRALHNGKAVLCEKPLAVSLSDGRAMVEAAEQTGLPNAVNFALADRHAVLEIERAMRAGEIGDVQGVDVRLGFPRWPREFQANAAWLAGSEQGGLVREVLSHFVYLTDRLLGPLRPRFVHLEPGAADAGSSEAAAFGLLDVDGVPVTVTARAGAALPETYEWYLHGTRRSYCLRDWGDLFASDGDQWRSVALHGERGSEATRLTAFASAVRDRSRPPLPDFRTGLRIQQVIEAFHHESRPA